MTKLRTEPRSVDEVIIDGKVWGAWMNEAITHAGRDGWNEYQAKSKRIAAMQDLIHSFSEKEARTIVEGVFAHGMKVMRSRDREYGGTGKRNQNEERRAHGIAKSDFAVALRRTNAERRKRPEERGGREERML